MKKYFHQIINVKIISRHDIFQDHLHGVTRPCRQESDKSKLFSLQLRSFIRVAETPYRWRSKTNLSIVRANCPYFIIFQICQNIHLLYRVHSNCTTWQHLRRKQLCWKIQLIFLFSRPSTSLFHCYHVKAR